MKLTSREIARYCAQPEPNRAGLLLYGADAMRVALRRQEVLRALIGPSGEEEMRLARMNGGDLRKNPADVIDAMRAQGFFPGPRAVFIEGANDSAAPSLAAALADWSEGDAILVVTAGSLAARSGLRALFEKHPNAYAAGIYNDPPGRDEIEAILSRAGLTDVGAEAMGDLTLLARSLDPGDFAQTMEKLALYKIGDTGPLNGADIAACAPATTEAELDEALNLVAEARVAEIGPVMTRLEGQGVNPTSICIGATRHFRILHAAAVHPKGVEAGLSAARPPVFGPRRDRMTRQARALGTYKLETALTILTDADLELRSSRPVPARALLERALIRIAMLSRS